MSLWCTERGVSVPECVSLWITLCFLTDFSSGNVNGFSMEIRKNCHVLFGSVVDLDGAVCRHLVVFVSQNFV